MLSGEVTEISIAALLPVAQFVNRRSAGCMGVIMVGCEGIDCFHLDSKMGPMARFSQNITKGVVSCHSITPMLTSDGIIPKTITI